MNLRYAALGASLPAAEHRTMALYAGSIRALLIAALLLPGAAGKAMAAEPPRIGIEATASFWWTAYEEVQNGLLQQGSSDPAADHASGFSFRHGRIGFTLGSPGGDLELLIKIRLEERTDIVDFYGAWLPKDWAHFYIGQMKIPSTAEVITPYDELDFASRSTFGRLVGDYALTRTPYISSVMAAKSYDRDLGIAVKGSLPAGTRPGLRWFLMASNGLGANRYIGGNENEEFLYTNSIGDMYLGARLEVSPVPEVTAGLHAGSNKHDDAALGDRGPVYDIGRKVWSADLAARLPWGQRIYGFYGRGSMDDFIEAQRYIFDYSGWGVQAVVPLIGGALEAALRFDRFISESGDDGNETVQDNWTAGVNFSPLENMRIQMNYTDKNTNNEFEADIGDNILLLNFQFFFDAPDIR